MKFCRLWDLPRSKIHTYKFIKRWILYNGVVVDMLLIHPAEETFGGILSRYVPKSLPVAVGIIAAYLKKWGVENIRIIDEEFDKLSEDDLQDRVKGLDSPLIIGITVMTSQARRSYELAEMFKKKYPDCTIVMGGVHVTALPHEALETGDVDFVVRGEGEEVMRQLYFALQEKKDWVDIKGISYVDKKGEIVNNPDGDLVENLDDIPIFPYELFDSSKYDLGHVASARGCPYKCTYCSQRLLTGFTYRWHSTERIVENLDILINKYNVKHISFYDDVFSVNKKSVLDLCEAMVAAGFHEKCDFTIQTRADNLYEDIMPALKSINTKTINIGMETGSERMAQVIAKDETVATHLEKIELCKKYDINVSLNMIFGFPSETQEERNESYYVAKNADVGFVKFNNLIPYPGTPIYEDAQVSGKMHILPGWSNCNSMLSLTRSILSPTPLPYVPEGTTEFELKRDIIKRNLQYYFQWKIIKRILTRQELGMGWAEVPKGWYLNVSEIFGLVRMSLVLGSNLLLSFLPSWIGDSIFTCIKRTQGIALPKDIKITSRTFKRAAVLQVEPEVEARGNVEEVSNV